MEEKVLKIGYTSYLEREKVKKENRTSKILNKIKEHKIITLAMGILVIATLINLILICNFILLLKSL